MTSPRFRNKLTILQVSFTHTGFCTLRRLIKSHQFSSENSSGIFKFPMSMDGATTSNWESENTQRELNRTFSCRKTQLSRLQCIHLKRFCFSPSVFIEMNITEQSIREKSLGISTMFPNTSDFTSKPNCDFCCTHVFSYSDR